MGNITVTHLFKYFLRSFGLTRSFGEGWGEVTAQ